MIKLLQDFLLMLLFKKFSIDCLFLLLMMIMMLIKLNFLRTVDIAKYKVLINGRNLYDQSINDLIKQYDEIRKIATGQGDDYATGCLLDYQYFKNHCKLIAVGLSKQEELDVDPRDTQQIEFYGMLGTN